MLNHVAELAKGIRPAVIDRAKRQRVRRDLDFRHFFRHDYDVDLGWAPMQLEATCVADTLAELRLLLNLFFENLRD